MQPTTCHTGWALYRGIAEQQRSLVQGTNLSRCIIRWPSLLCPQWGSIQRREWWSCQWGSGQRSSDHPHHPSWLPHQWSRQDIGEPWLSELRPALGGQGGHNSKQQLMHYKWGVVNQNNWQLFQTKHIWPLWPLKYEIDKISAPSQGSQ